MTQEKYRSTLTNFVGETRLLTCGDTLQVSDYSRFNWTMFDPDAKKQRRADTFDTYLQKAFQMGADMV